MKENQRLLRIAAGSGLVSAIFILIWLPVMLYSTPGFSYTQNWISDLGGLGFSSFTRHNVATPLTMVLLFTMLLVVGTLNTVFSLGLISYAKTAGYRYASASTLASSLSFILVAIFPEPTLGGIPHVVFGNLTFLLLAVAELLIGFSERKSGQAGIGNFSIGVGVMVLSGLILYSPLRGAGELILWIEQMIWITFMSCLLWERSIPQNKVLA